MRTIFLILFSVFSVLHAQEIITHSDARDDDGDPAKDGDRKVNNVVVWKGGQTHALNTRYYNVYSGYTLVIERGAIVNGDPQDEILGENALDSRYEITGAAINDISFTGFHGPGSFVKKSRLNNCQFDLPQGGVFRDNEIKGGSVSTVSPAVKEGIEENPPLIKDNTFEEATVSAFGSAVLIQNNTFFDTRVMGSRKTAVESIRLGYAKSANGTVYPSGQFQTQITDNTITSGGLLITSRINNLVLHEAIDNQPLKVLIQGNTLWGFTDNDVQKGVGLTLEPFTDTQVINNELSGFSVLALLRTELKSDGDTDSREPHDNFAIKNNVFKETNDYGMMWQSQYGPRGTLDEKDFVNATNNYWGHRTGPNDASESDGFYLDGQGLSVEDYITYTPFQGQMDILAAVSLDVKADDEDAYFQGATYYFDADVTYKLYEGPATLEIRITDDRGLSIVDPKPQMTIQAGERTVSFEAMKIDMPANTSWISCQARIRKDAVTVVSSNIEDFFVFDPGYSIRFIDFEIEPTQEGKQEYIPGVNTQVTFKTEHTFPDLPGENTGRLLIVVNEYKKGTANTFLQNFEVRLLPASPGENLKTNVTISLTPQLRDIYSNRTKIVIEAKLLVNDEEKAIVIQENNVSTDANHVELSNVTSLVDIQKRSSEDTTPFCIEDELARFNIGKLAYQTLTPHLNGVDFSGWRVTSAIEYSYHINDEDRRYHTSDLPMYSMENPEKAFSIDVTQKSDEFMDLNITSAREADYDYALLKFLLHAPEVGIVFESSGYLKVVDADDIEEYGVPVGESNVNFNKIPFECTFRGSSREGNVTGVQITGRLQLLYYLTYWKMIEAVLDKTTRNQSIDIQLNRYWEFYTDLPANSFAVDMSITYDPETDFPEGVIINEDSLTVAVWDSTLQDLIFVPTERNVEANELTVTLTDLNTPIVIGMPNPQSTWAENPEILEIPDKFSLSQNYPNPFNGETVIRFGIPDESHVRLDVFDIQGRRIATLVDQRMVPGNHEVIWLGRKLSGEPVSSGLYVYCLRGGRRRANGKMLYMK